MRISLQNINYWRFIFSSPDSKPKRDEVIRDWRKLHNKKLHNLYLLPSTIRIIKSRRIRWTGHVASMGTKRNAYRLLVGKPEEKRRRREGNIQMDLTDVAWAGMDWIDVAEDRDQ
jgi:hypothetical protein